MGSKGTQGTPATQSGYTNQATNQSNNQSQTYAPNGAAYNAITGALAQGQGAAANPFSAPIAPVAGFSPQQQQAFGIVGNAQGMAQPYFNQAQGLFNQAAQGPNVGAFYNPYAQNVFAAQNDLFGQQMSQATGQLTQAAGGVGADRIAVGQSELARQQQLAQGQTAAGIYQSALGAAQGQQSQQQSAAFGLGNLGGAAQNATLQGAQSLLGVGGLQQQLQQAQLNAPYQNQLSALAYPFQTAQFNAGITGALAPGLGGTTTGTGSQSGTQNGFQNGSQMPSGPSALSQILGAGAAGTGILGQTGAFGNNGWMTGGNSGKGGGPQVGGTQNVMNGQGQGVGFDGSGNALPGNIMASARGGAVNPYAFDDGGAVDPYIRMAELQGLRSEAAGDPNAGSAGLPSGLNGRPIDSAPQSMVPSEQLTSIRPNTPSLNLSMSPMPQLPQQSQRAASQNTGGGSIFKDIGSIAGTLIGGPGVGTAVGNLAGTAADGITGIKRGGRIDPHKFDGANPYAFDDGGDIPLPTPDPRTQDFVLQRIHDYAAQSGRQPEDFTGSDVMKLQRQIGVTSGRPERPSRYADGGSPTFDERSGNGVMFDPAAFESPPRDPRVASNIDASDISLNAGPGGYGAGQPVNGGDTDQGSASPYAPVSRSVGARAGQPPASGLATGAAGPSSPYAEREQSMAASPWAALTAAGFGMLASRSPFAGVAIGEGGLRGLQTLEQQRQAGQKDTTIEQAARHLDQEAQFHQDQYTKMTPYQQGELDTRKSELQKPVPMGQHVDPTTLMPMTTYGVRQPDGSFKPVDLQSASGPSNSGASGSGAMTGVIDPAAVHDMAISYVKGNTAVMQNLGFGRIGGVNRARLWNEVEAVLKANGTDGADLAAAKANFGAQSAAARTAGVRGANIDMAVQEAQQTFPLGLEASAALPRGGFVPWNKAVQMVQAGTSSPELARFVTANQAIITAYSQAMSRTGVNTVHAQSRAEDLLSTATSPESYQAVLDQMGKEMHAAQLAPEAVRRDIEGKISGKPATGAAPASPARSPQDQQAIDWASANPNDPRAAKIKQRLGVQ